MCVTYCHRCSILFFNHTDCPAHLCPARAEVPGPCADCRHRQGQTCGLTRAPAPATGCCHWNVSPADGPQPISMAQCTLLGPGANETLPDLLAGLDAPFRLDAAGRVRVDPAALGLPDVYGRGVD